MGAPVTMVTVLHDCAKAVVEVGPARRSVWFENTSSYFEVVVYKLSTAEMRRNTKQFGVFALL